MTKRKNRRSLGSPPAVHQAAASGAASRTMRALEETNEALQSGRCGRAAFSLAEANENLGRTAAHVATLNDEVASRGVEFLAQKRDAAESNFVAKCLKK